MELEGGKVYGIMQSQKHIVLKDEMHVWVIKSKRN